MAEENVPTETPFLYQSVPASSAEAASEDPVVWSSRIARAALIGYFKRYFDGDLNHVLQALAPRTAVSFATDSVRAESQDKRTLQLARKMAMLHQELPCILVADTGGTIIQPGLGAYEKKYKHDGDIVCVRVRTYTVGIEIAVGHQTEDGANELAEVVSVMLENRHRVGSILTDNDGGNWEVRLPMQHQKGNATPQPVGEDPAQTFATASITADVQVEVWYFEKIPATKSADVSGIVGRFNSSTYRNVTFPASVALNQKPTIYLRGYPPTIKVRTDDPNVALVNESRQIVPLTVGTCQIVVYEIERGIDQRFPLTITV